MSMLMSQLGRGQSLLHWVNVKLQYLVLFASGNFFLSLWTEYLKLVYLHSVLAATTEEPNSIFGVYLWAGTVVLLMPCLKVSLAQRTFEVIVYMSIICSVIWLFVRASSILKVVKRD